GSLRRTEHGHDAVDLLQQAGGRAVVWAQLIGDPREPLRLAELCELAVVRIERDVMPRELEVDPVQCWGGMQRGRAQTGDGLRFVVVASFLLGCAEPVVRVVTVGTRAFVSEILAKLLDEGLGVRQGLRQRALALLREPAALPPESPHRDEAGKAQQLPDIG